MEQGLPFKEGTSSLFATDMYLGRGNRYRTLLKHGSAIMNQIFQPMSRNIQNHAIYRFFIATSGQGTLFSKNVVNPVFDV